MAETWDSVTTDWNDISVNWDGTSGDSEEQTRRTLRTGYHRSLQ